MHVRACGVFSIACSSAATLCSLRAFVRRAALMSDVHFPSVHVCITTHCNNAPGACLCVYIHYSHISECVCVFRQRGLGVRINRWVPLQPHVCMAIGEETALTSLLLVPRGSMATSAYPLYIIDGLVMVPLQQDSNLVDVLTQG